MGFSFAAGTTDGPGAFSFTQGNVQLLWRSLPSLFKLYLQTVYFHHFPFFFWCGDVSSQIANNGHYSVNVVHVVTGLYVHIIGWLHFPGFLTLPAPSFFCGATCFLPNWFNLPCFGLLPSLLPVCPLGIYFAPFSGSFGWLCLLLRPHQFI
jgi:hypothetical protein